MVKFKIGFTIEAETLFAYISKFMPNLKDLHVEEVYDAPHVASQHISKVAQKVMQNQITHEKRSAPHPRGVAHQVKQQKPHFRHPSGKSLKILLKEFFEEKNSDLTWAQMSKFAQSIGFEKSSINNAVVRLIEDGIIEKKAIGIYGLRKN